MKDLTLCIACVILGILLSMLFKQACGCKQVVEGLGENCTLLMENGMPTYPPLPNNDVCDNGEVCQCPGSTCICEKRLPTVPYVATN